MRIAVLILGLILGAIMFFQALLVTALSGVTEDATTGSAGAVGWLMALFWLIGCALVIPLPLVSVVALVLAGIAGLNTATGSYKDLSTWGGVSLVLAVLSFIGWIGKRRGARREVKRHEELVSAVRLAGPNQVAVPIEAVSVVKDLKSRRHKKKEVAASLDRANQRASACLNCGQTNDGRARLCSECGVRLNPQPMP